MYVGKLLLFSMLVTIEGLVLNNLVNSMFPLAIDVPRYLTPINPQPRDRENEREN